MVNHSFKWCSGHSSFPSSACSCPLSFSFSFFFWSSYTLGVLKRLFSYRLSPLIAFLLFSSTTLSYQRPRETPPKQSAKYIQNPCENLAVEDYGTRVTRNSIFKVIRLLFPSQLYHFPLQGQIMKKKPPSEGIVRSPEKQDEKGRLMGLSPGVGRHKATRCPRHTSYTCE